ncbi:sugar transporter STL1 [Hortaea werneckii]|nr:sugar transporter STL1 [Hortaea werneckii]
MTINPRVYQLLVGLFAALGSFTYGYDLGVIGGSVASDTFKARFGLSADETGAVVSVFTGGGFFGAMVAGTCADRLGRRLAIIVGALIFILGGVLQASAQNFGYLLGGRIVAGLGVGMLVMIIPLYQAEIAHPDIRGRITAFQQLLLGVGACTATFVVYGTTKDYKTELEWRLPLGIQVIPTGILALLILLFPESPRWLIGHDRQDSGLKTLARLHANGDISDPWVCAEFDQICRSIALEREGAAKGYRELFEDRTSFRRLLLTTALQASVQMTGVSAIQYFTPTIYSNLNIGTTASLKYQGISNALSIVAQACTAIFIDKIGRRWPLIIGNLINGLCFVVITAIQGTFLSSSPSRQDGLGWGFIVTNWIYQVSFSFTCGSLSWIIPAEIFDTKTRSKGVSIGVMTSFAFNTLIGQITEPALSGSNKWAYFLLFVVCNFTNALFFWAFMPETKKRPLEEMNVLFAQTSWFVPTTNTKALGSDMAVRLEEKRLKREEEKIDEHVVCMEKATNN